MATVQSQSFCPTCKQDRLFTKNATNHLAHAVVTLFLCGMWLPIWILATLSNDMTPGRCTQCGGTAGGGIGIVGKIIAGALAILIGISVFYAMFYGRTGSSELPPKNEPKKSRAATVDSPSVSTVPAESKPDPKTVAAERENARKEKLAATTLKYHQELADKGDPYGWFQMGKRYLNGDGVAKDQAEAVRLLKMAAGGGQEDAVRLLEKLGEKP